MSDFPNVVRAVAAPAVAGDFASTNPRANALGSYVASPQGLNIGLFAWADPTNTTLSNNGPGAPTGFIARESQGLITQYLASSGFTIPPGMGATAYTRGDFWALNAGTSTSAIGDVIYANSVSGQAISGYMPVSASVTAALVANSVTATLAANSITACSISGTTLTVTSVGAGTVLAPGQYLSGGATGNSVDPSTAIVAQLTGTAGGVGTYQVSVSQTVSNAAITATGGSMTVTATGTGTVAVGQIATAPANLVAGTTVTALGTGTGTNTGTYALSAAPATPGAGVTVTLSGGTLNVTAVASGSLAVNDSITGGTIAANTYITAQVSGTAGGVGSYLVSTSTPSTSGTVTVNGGVATAWRAANVAAPGELIKMASWV